MPTMTAPRNYERPKAELINEAGFGLPGVSKPLSGWWILITNVGWLWFGPYESEEQAKRIFHTAILPSFKNLVVDDTLKH